MEDGSRGPAGAFGPVFQLGIVVADLDARMEGMRKAFGVEPFVVQECRYPEVRYGGKPVDAWARIAKYDQFGVLLEFVEPHGEASMWSDALAASPNGQVLHTIRFADVADNDAVTAAMAERGIGLLQEGDSIIHPGGKFSFYDTQDLVGFVTEVVTAAPEA